MSARCPSFHCMSALAQRRHDETTCAALFCAASGLPQTSVAQNSVDGGLPAGGDWLPDYQPADYQLLYQHYECARSRVRLDDSWRAVYSGGGSQPDNLGGINILY